MVTSTLRRAALAFTLLGSACLGDADHVHDARTVDFSFTDDLYGVVESGDGWLHGQVISAESGDVVAEATWDTDAKERTLWTLYQPEPMTESLAPLPDVDNAGFLVNDLAVIVQMTDGDPDNDALEPTDGASSYRANNYLPRGTLDRVTLETSSSPARIRVQGWACDPDRYGTALQVHIYGSFRIAGGGYRQVYKGALTANRQRELGVGHRCGGQRARGFDGRSSPVTEIVTDGAARVAAINIDSSGRVSGSNPVLDPGWRLFYPHPGGVTKSL